MASGRILQADSILRILEISFMEAQFMKCMEDKGLRIKMKVHYGYWLTSGMRKLVFLLFFVLSHSVCFGQDLRNSSKMLVGKIDANGIVRDYNNMTIGKIESDGDIRDRNSMLVGKIERNGTILDKNNMTIGKVESDGTVRDCYNMTMGRIEADGTVRNRNSLTIGYAKGIPKAYAAVFFFFGMFGK